MGPVPDGIAHLLHLNHKALKAVGGSDGLFHIGLYQSAPGGLSFPAFLPFGVRLTFSIGHDGGQSVFPAQLIGYLTDSPVVGGKIVAEHFTVQIGYRIDDHMIVQMSFVEMCGYRTFKAVGQKAAGKLAADFMGLCGGGFPRRKTLDNVIPQHAFVSWFAPPPLGSVHHAVCRLRRTVKAGHIKLMFCFVGVLCVGECASQVRGGQHFCFVGVGSVVQTALQMVVNGDDFRIGHIRCFPQAAPRFPP